MLNLVGPVMLLLLLVIFSLVLVLCSASGLFFSTRWLDRAKPLPTPIVGLWMMVLMISMAIATAAVFQWLKPQSVGSDENTALELPSERPRSEPGPVTTEAEPDIRAWAAMEERASRVVEAAWSLRSLPLAAARWLSKYHIQRTPLKRSRKARAEQIRIVCDTPEARAYVDGEGYRELPLTMKMGDEPVRIRVILEGHVSRVFSFEPGKKKSHERHVRFRKDVTLRIAFLVSGSNGMESVFADFLSVNGQRLRTRSSIYQVRVPLDQTLRVEARNTRLGLAASVAHRVKPDVEGVAPLIMVMQKDSKSGAPLLPSKPSPSKLEMSLPW